MKRLYPVLALMFVTLSACSTHKGASPSSQVDSSKDTSATAVASTSSNSIYDAGALPFVDQNGHAVSWSDLKGTVRVMAMIFTHCEYACPRITKDIQNVERLLPKDPRIVYTLVSFDVDRDSVQQLRTYYRKMGLDSSWLLLHGSEADTRTVSALLDVKYEKMADGAFSHQSVILVIDQNGQIAMRREGLEGDPKDVADKVRGLLTPADSRS
jgi:protein SCO1/2